MTIEEMTRQDTYQPGASTTFRLVSESGDRLTVAVSPTGLTMIQAESQDEAATLGSIVVGGLTPQQAAKKSKGFWAKLWDKIKKVAEDVIEAVTFDAGPFTCRPTATVGFQDDRVTSVTVGLSCRD
jgi:hypothetical protein